MARMTVPVVWLTRHESVDAHGPWDIRILDYLFHGSLWTHPWKFEHYYNHDSIDPSWTRAVVVLPARFHATPDDIEWLNGELAKLKSCLLILAGDEEGVFPWKVIMHDH